MTRDEPISPELALVSPELRAEALALLPPPPRAANATVERPDGVGEAAHRCGRSAGPFTTVEVTVHVPVVLVAAAYLLYELAVRVTSGVALATVLVLAQSLVAG